MARTSKTVIGGDVEARTRALREASATGQASQQRASETLSQEHRAQAQLKAQGGAAVGQSISQYQDRELQADIATGQEIQHEADRNLEAAKQGLEVTAGGLESPLLARHRQGLEGQVADGKEAEKQLGDQKAPTKEAAQPAATGGAAQAQMAPSPAVSQLQNPQQAQQQAQTPVEQRRPGSYGPTQRALQQEQRAQSAAAAEFGERQLEVDAKMITANAAHLNAQGKAGEAAQKTRDNAIKVMQDGMKFTREQMSGLADNPERARIMAGAFPGNPDVEMALAAGTGTEANPQLQATVMRLLDNQLAMQNINYMAVTGGAAPDYSGYNEIWQRFNMHEAEINAAFRGDVALGPLGGGDPTATQPFAEAIRAAGGAVDIDPVAEGNQGGAMRRAWAGFTGKHAFEQKQQFLRKATARAMVEIQELERRGESGLKVSGMAQQLAQSNQRVVQLEAQVAQQNAELGYGPQPFAEPGANVTELPGGQRVPTDRAAGTQKRIEAREAGKPIQQPLGEEIAGREGSEAFNREEQWRRQHPGAY